MNIYDYAFEKQAEMILIYHFMYPYYTKAMIERHRYNLGKVIESTGILSSYLDPTIIYNNALHYALDVIPKCDICTLWWFDEQSKQITCQASFGNVLKGIELMEFRENEGPIGYTLTTGTPILYETGKVSLLQSIKRSMTSLSSNFDQVSWSDLA